MSISTDFLHECRGRRTWIIDVDDTLYPMSSGLHQRIKSNIVEAYSKLAKADKNLVDRVADILDQQKIFLSDASNISHADLGVAFPPIVQAVQELYENELDAYLRQFYGNDYGLICPDARLTKAFQQAHNKGIDIYFYTNGPWQHVEKVMQNLGFQADMITMMRERTFDLLDSVKRGRGKPTVESMHDFLYHFNIDPKDALFIDDDIKNLVTASKTGIKPVWAWTQDKPQPEQSDIEVSQSIQAQRIRYPGEFLEMLTANP